jgi:hypothetical protein
MSGSAASTPIVDIHLQREPQKMVRFGLSLHGLYLRIKKTDRHREHEQKPLSAFILELTDRFSTLGETLIFCRDSVQVCFDRWRRRFVG